MDVPASLAEFGVDPSLRIHSRRLLHRRWPAIWFARLHRRRLTAASAVYVRNPELSLALSEVGIAHHFEVHQVRALAESGQLESVVRFHRAGIIRWLIPISRAAAQALTAAGADPTRLHSAPSGVDTEAYESVPPLLPEALAHMRALYIGRVSRTRGLNVLRHLAENKVTEVLLVGDQEDTVASIPGLSTRPFLAPVHLPRLYHDTTVILLPYQPELPHGDAISPLKLFEAMAAGRPIIASNLPSIREIVDHGRTGLLVPPTDLVAWERAIEKLRANPALAIELASNARRAVEQFSWRSRAAGIATCVGWLRPRP
jgi:glycosyltransferase involved in cell wall biosynthesis